MALPKLTAFHVPGSVSEALTLLGQYEDGLPLAGGTFIRGLDARGLLAEVTALVDVRRIGSAQLCASGAELKIGAAVTFGTLAATPEVATAPWLAALAEALKHPPMQVRNSATLGGCIAAACPFFDIPTALLALGAEVEVEGAGGARRLALAELFTGMFTNSLAKAELVTAVVLPVPPAGSASGFAKLATNANDLAIVNAAVRVRVDTKGICQDAAVALGGGIGETALRVAAAEKVLTGVRIDATVLQKLDEAVGGGIEPFSDHRASASYRKAMAKVMVRRALERALARLG